MPTKNTIELRMPSKPEYVAIARALVTELARYISLPRSAIEDIQVAVSEACANVVSHAYSEGDYVCPELLIRCNACDDDMRFEVIDSGDGFASPVTPMIHNPEDHNGFGLIIMEGLMDQFSLHTIPDQGTVVRMAKKRKKTRSPRSDIIDFEFTGASS